MNTFRVSAIATVKNARREVEDDHWGEVVSILELDPAFHEEALSQIETFSHVEVFFLFHLVKDENIVRDARHPRNNRDLPRVGIFAQRGKNRPNRLGATICKVIQHEGRQLHVQGLDAIDGTPILDIKPVMREFLPCEEVTQPEWATELMKEYW
jgi:tRNA (adenine37-N6)-methyltransferase